MTNTLEKLITKRFQNLTKNQKKIAEYILKNPEEVAFLSIRELGKKVGVSDATVVRLSTNLGISGFSKLQEMLQSWLKAKLTPSEKLKRAKLKKSDIYSSIFEKNIENIIKAKDEIPISKIEEIIDILDKAKRIFILGLRRSHSFAFHLFYNLSRILNKVFFIDPQFGLIYDQVNDINNRDVIIIISFSRYARVTLQILKIAKNKKVFAIAITDNPLSPVAQLADINICVDYESPFFFGSHASTLVVLDCIVGGLSLRHKNRSIKSLKKLEETLEQFGVWVK